MTLDNWLAQATLGLPAAARLRLEAEYRAHWEASKDMSSEDVASGAASSASPTDLFGPPGEVRLQLRRLYLSQRQLA